MGSFDTVCPGDTLEQTFQLLDKGIDSIDVLNALVSGNGFTLVQAPERFSGTGGFEVRFVPTAEQSYTGSLSVTADSCGTTFTLPLEGSGGPLPKILALDTMYNFGNLLAGDSSTYCLSVTNPSCSPITVWVDSSAFAGTPFQMAGQTSNLLLARGDTAQVCVQFSPTTYGSFASRLLLNSDSAPTQKVVLQGVGLAPDVRFNPHLLDFGYVLYNTSKALTLYDTNFGNLATTIGHSNINPPFTMQTAGALSGGANDSIPVTFAPVTGTGLVYDTVHLAWSGHADSVILRGYGTPSGLQLSVTGLDFGNVHIGTDSTHVLYLFARNNVPKIDSVSIPSEVDTFSYNTQPALPHQIQSDSDSIRITITYHAHREQPDLDSLLIYSGGNIVSIPLIANGVEAHAKVSILSVLFDTVILGQSSSIIKPITLSDTGGYPLFVAALPPDTVFQITSPDSPTAPILAHSSRPYSISFHPVRARTVVDTLQYITTAPNAVPPVLLIGTGAYPAGTGPAFGYSVAPQIAQPGEFDSIPIYLSGVRLSKIDADTMSLTIRFDPLMVRMQGADEGQNLPPVSAFRHIDDSTVEATIVTSTFTGGTIMRLRTEALLGPHPVSYIHVVQSAPAATQPEPASDGQFTVEDCGGLVHGVIFAGPYSTSAIVPNPVGDKAQLHFVLGLDGPVTVDLYNSIGQMVTHVDAGTAKAGPHTLLLDVSALPQGRYVYRLSSLDYQAQGSLVVLR